MTISLNCYLETFIQNKQNLLFLYFCKIVQAYIQQSNWLLVQNCPNIHQTQDIWRRSGVYRWCHMVLRAPPIQAPSITLLGEEMPRKVLYFLIRLWTYLWFRMSVTHKNSLRLKWYDSCWWRFQLNTFKWWYQKDNLISQGATEFFLIQLLLLNN